MMNFGVLTECIFFLLHLLQLNILQYFLLLMLWGNNFMLQMCDMQIEIIRFTLVG
jgi:hypothetical protein